MTALSMEPIERPADGCCGARAIRVQRKCACGAPAASGDVCRQCQHTSPGMLAVDSLDDPLEHEAGRIAEQVMEAPAPEAGRGLPIRVRRAGGAATGPVGAAPPSVERTLSGAGQPIESATRHDMARRFRHDFFDVRVHTGGDAHASARDLGAQAWTSGPHIVFAAGRYAPGTQDGRRLLAHELAHVLQQDSIVRRAPNPNALDKTAQEIVDAATKDKPDEQTRATNAVNAIIAAYYPGEAAKVSKLVFDPKEKGLSTRPAGTGPQLKGIIFVGPTFLEGIDHIARRVLQVGHELQHIDQERGGMGGRPATDPQASCEKCEKDAPGDDGKPGKTSATRASVQPPPTKVMAGEVKPDEAGAKPSPAFSVAVGGEVEVAKGKTETETETGTRATPKATLSVELSIPLAEMVKPGGVRAGSLGGAPLKSFDKFSLAPAAGLKGGAAGGRETPLALEASLKMVSLEWEKLTRAGTFTLGLGLEASAAGEYTPQTRKGELGLGGAAGAELDYKPGKNVFIRIEATAQGTFDKSGDARFEWSGVSFSTGIKAGFTFGGK